MKIKLINRPPCPLGKVLLRFIMKSIIFFFCSISFALSPINGEAQDAEIIIDSDVTLNVKQVFRLINRQTDYKFIYRHDLIKTSSNIDLKKGVIKAGDLLDKALSPISFTYDFTDGGTIVVKKMPVDSSNSDPNILADQNMQFQVSGTVTDNEGTPLPGANILEKGTTNGIQVDFDGNFTIAVEDENAVLVVSYVGFATKEVNVGGQTSMTVILEESAAGLDEVVVVGYGTQKKVNLTGAIASVSSKDLVVVPTTNTTAALAGRLPGLIVHQTSGQPGYDVADIRIRGFGNALVIVDGIQRDFTQLDPNEIESVSVLKDASAAVYGAQAGNGVILVTTKRGTVSAPEINFNSTYSISQNALFPKYVDAFKFATMYSRAEGGLGAGFRFSQDDIDKYEEGTSAGFVSTDWQDRIMRKGAPMSQQNLNVRGGTEKVQYFFSVGNLDQESIWKSGDGFFKRNNVTSNLNVEITDRLSAQIDLNYRREQRENPISSVSNIFNNLNFADPTVDVANFPFPDLLQDSAPLRSGENNVIASMTQAISGFQKRMDGVFNGTAYLEYKLPIKGLTVDGRVAYRKYESAITNFNTPFDVYNYDYDAQQLNGPLRAGISRIEKQAISEQRITTQLAIRYNGLFGDHAITGLLLNERINENGDTFIGQRSNVLSNSLPYLFAGDASTAVANDINLFEDGRNSWVGRFNYDYKGKYLVEATFRYDASPRFPKEGRWGFFPGVQFGWRVSEETFLKNNNVVGNLKLRATASRTGFDDISSYDYLTGYEIFGGNGLGNNVYVLGGEQLQQLRTIGLANPYITWENIDLYNLGFDASFLNNSIGIEFDYFYRKRSGMLQNRLATVPNTFGANLPAENIESQDNRGFEVVLSYKNNRREFKYDISGNITFARAKWIHKEEREFTPGDDERINRQSGQWVNRTFGYLTDGLFNTQEEIDNATINYDQADNATLSPGDYKYVDVNGDGIITVNDQVELGRGRTPEVMFGLNTSASYKGFDFSMLWQGASRFVQWFSGDNIAGLRQGSTNPLEYQWKYQWNPDNIENAELPAANLVGLSVYNDRRTDVSTKDATYVRLKNLSIGYSLPSSPLSTIGVKRLRLYISGTNLLTFANLGIFEDYDPEISRTDSQRTYPIQKVYSIGINITL